MKKYLKESTTYFKWQKYQNKHTQNAGNYGIKIDNIFLSLKIQTEVFTTKLQSITILFLILSVDKITYQFF